MIGLSNPLPNPDFYLTLTLTCLYPSPRSSNNLLQSRWVDFIATNIVGSIALTWVLGITYMLTVTLSVLQLREVLHPDILAKSIRPQVHIPIYYMYLYIYPYIRTCRYTTPSLTHPNTHYHTPSLMPTRPHDNPLPGTPFGSIKLVTQRARQHARPPYM